MSGSYEKYRSYKGTVGKIAPNILNRNFQAENQMKSGLQILRSLNYLGEVIPITNVGFI